VGGGGGGGSLFSWPGPVERDTCASGSPPSPLPPASEMEHSLASKQRLNMTELYGMYIAKDLICMSALQLWP